MGSIACKIQVLKGLIVVLVALTAIAFLSGEALAGKVVGNIGSVKVDHCGIAPGSCKGAVVVTKMTVKESLCKLRI